MSNRSSRVLPDLAALQAEIDRLKAENETLASANQAGIKAPSVTLEEYQGKPVLHFQGNFRPFHMGLSKCKAIRSFDTEVSAFIKSNGKKIS